MAVIPIQFGQMKNSTGGQHTTVGNMSETTPKYSNPVSNDDLGLYRSDNRNDRQKFIDQMPNINPAFNSMSNVGSGINESGHVYEYLNPYRTCDLMIGSKAEVPFNDQMWGNWRNLEPNEPSTQIVPNNVVLTLEEPKIGFQFTHQVESAFQGLQDKGFLKNMSGLLEVARLAASSAGVGENYSTSGRFQSRYAKVPAWKDTSALQIEAALTFKFSFGQFGLFSGEWEVVRPILALAHHFSLRSNGRYVRGPAPTPPAYLISLFNEAASRGLAGDIASRVGAVAGSSFSALKNSAGGNKADAASDLENSVVELTAIEDSLYKTMDDAIANTMKAGPLYTIAIRVGRLVVGSIFVKNVRWSFDYANLDEYGFPCSGEITLSDLEMIYYPLPWTFMNVFDTGVESQRFSENAKTFELPEGAVNG